MFYLTLPREGVLLYVLLFIRSVLSPPACNPCSSYCPRGWIYNLVIKPTRPDQARRRGRCSKSLRQLHWFPRQLRRVIARTSVFQTVKTINWYAPRLSIHGQWSSKLEISRGQEWLYLLKEIPSHLQSFRLLCSISGLGLGLPHCPAFCTTPLNFCLPAHLIFPPFPAPPSFLLIYPCCLCKESFPFSFSLHPAFFQQS